MDSTSDVTQLLLAWKNGDAEALSKLTPLVYDELRRLAAGYLRRERPDHTIQPTALVHEAFIRLIDQNGIAWQNRAHFFGIAARLMRQILVNYAHAHQAAKRGGQARKLSLSAADGAVMQQALDITALNEALTKLESIDERKSRIVELRFFAGLSIEEAAEVMGISHSTIKREWRMARAWLYAELTGELDSPISNE